MFYPLNENIRRYRTVRALTQERLAELLHVTPQAISRWENGSVIPDLPTLIAMANLFAVSLDELVGRDSLRGRDTITEIHHAVCRARADGDDRRALTMLDDALTVYPNDEGLGSEYTVTAARMDDLSADELSRAIQMAEAVLVTSHNTKLLATTRANLVFLLLRAGEQERAADVARSLPHIWESREILMAEVADAYPAALRESIVKALTVLAVLIEEARTHRVAMPGAHIAQGVDWKREGGQDAVLTEIRAFLRDN